MEITSSSTSPRVLNAPSIRQASGGNQPNQTTQQVGKSFADVLDALSRSENQSNALIQKLAAGEDVEIHQVMMAVEETDVNFRIAIAIRDRLVDAYREVMRMSV